MARQTDKLGNKKPPALKTASLTVHPEPFKPSYLSIPPSPFSPRVPITPDIPSRNQRAKCYGPVTTTSASPPPHSPLQWLWQCHKCHRTYQLGVTRRCLDDGHFFCAGTMTIKSWRKSVNPRRVRQHRACASEFDYHGWKSWGRWRRNDDGENVLMTDAGRPPSNYSVLSTDTESESERKLAKDCWNKCDYPSECRWGKQFGIRTPPKRDVVATPPCPPPPPPPPEPTLEVQLEGSSEECAKKSSKGDFWGALLASATRRRTVGSSSPLALPPVEEEPEKEMEEAETVKPLSPAQLSSNSSTSSGSLSLSSMAPVTLMDLITKKGKKGKTKTSELKSSEPAVTAGSPGHPREGLAPVGSLERIKGCDSGYFSQHSEEAAGK